MDAQRQQALVDFVRDQLKIPRRKVRNLCLLMLGLCLALLGMMVSIATTSRSATAGDLALPVVLGGAFTLFALAGLIWAGRDLERHPLVQALRARPPTLAAVRPVTVYTDGGAIPGLEFELRTGWKRCHVIQMSEETRDELLDWLLPPGGDGSP